MPPLYYRTLLIGFVAAAVAYYFGVTADPSVILWVPILLVLTVFFFTLLILVVHFLLWPARRLICLIDGHTFGEPISLGPDSGEFGSYDCTRCGASSHGRD
ncbi:MAG: hypothetical protein CMM61_03430 [Rhodospirillaceae bacterium]|nr:hypothetical protein [Rhodospirillaceae bacterium]